jgi:hypothetical protein
MSLQAEGRIPDGVLGALNMLSRANSRYANFLQEVLVSGGDSYFPSDLDDLERKAAAQIKKWSGRSISLKVSGYVPHPSITPDIAIHFIRLLSEGCTAEQASRQQAIPQSEAEQMEVDYQDFVALAKRRTGLARDQYLQDLLASWRKN